jgi:hypothetical protein
MSKMPMLINMLITNPKVIVHGKSILSLYELAFKLSLPKDSPPGSPLQQSSPKIRTVDSYISYLIGKCDKSSSMAVQAKRSVRKDSAEAADQKLFQSLVVTPRSSAFSPGGHSHTFLYDDSGEGMKSSIDQEPKMQMAEDLITSMVHKSLVLLIDQAEIHLEKQRKLKLAMPRGTPEHDFQREVSESIPIFSVPRLDERNLLLYSKTYKVSLVNEISATAGLFGWCFMCRSTADFYCKDNRVPICGKKCKEALVQFHCRSMLN